MRKYWQWNWNFKSKIFLFETSTAMQMLQIFGNFTSIYLFFSFHNLFLKAHSRIAQPFSKTFLVYKAKLLWSVQKKLAKYMFLDSSYLTDRLHKLLTTNKITPPYANMRICSSFKIHSFFHPVGAKQMQFPIFLKISTLLSKVNG